MSYFDGVTASEHGDALREFSRRLNRQATELVEAQEFATMATELTGVSRDSLWPSALDSFCHASAARLLLALHAAAWAALLLRASSDCCSAVGGWRLRGRGWAAAHQAAASPARHAERAQLERQCLTSIRFRRRMQAVSSSLHVMRLFRALPIVVLAIRR